MSFKMDPRGAGYSPPTVRRLIAVAAVWVWVTPTPAAAQEVQPGTRMAFEYMADYLSREGGQWRTENPNYDPSNPRSPEAYGLWFDRLLEGHILQITIVGFLGGDPIPSWRGQWVWHPGTGDISYSTVSRRGGRSMGTTRFLDDTTFVTVTQDVSPLGATTWHRDENYIVSDNVHRNSSYALDETGNWARQGGYVWTRQTVLDAGESAFRRRPPNR